MLNLLRSTPRISRARYTNPAPSTTVGVLRMQSAGWDESEDEVMDETPVAIVINGLTYAATEVLAGHLEDFALGFCVTEGLVGAADELLELETRLDAGRITLDLTLLPRCDAALRQRMCRPFETPATPRMASAPLAGVRVELIDRCLRGVPGAPERSPHFALWSDLHGQFNLLREDLQPPHAFDKLAGALLRQGCSPHAGFALCSGNASASTLERALRAGISALVLTGTPTARAIALARSAGLLLIGLARPGHLLVYTQAHRLAGGMPARRTGS